MLSEKHWRPEEVIMLMVGVLVCILGGAFLIAAIRYYVGSGFEDTTWRSLAALISFQGAALLLVHFFVRKHGTRWTEAFGLANNIARAIVVGLIVALLTIPLAWTLQRLSLVVLDHFSIATPTQEAVQALGRIQNPAQAIAMGFAAIILAPLAEEVLFRGVLYPSIKQFGFPRVALWGTSFLFAVIHASLPIFLPLLMLSIVLTLVYEKTDNLLAPVVAHMLFNATNFIMYFVAKTQ